MLSLTSPHGKSAKHIGEFPAAYFAGTESEQDTYGAEPYRCCVWHILYHRRAGNGEQPGTKYTERSEQPRQQYDLH